jgi:hypothetical protein
MPPAGAICAKARPVSLLTLAVVLVVFGAEVGWLCRC